MSDQTATGYAKPSDTSSHYNVMNFLIRMVLNRINTCTLVSVQKAPYDQNGNPLNEQLGNVAGYGFVDVQPLVNLVDGAGNPTQHAIVYGVPFLRLQGGSGAFIADPAVGDIGICVFADHDISSVKANQAQANPGSFRRFSMPDGLYIGGVLNPSPQMYFGFIGNTCVITPDNGTTWIQASPGNIQVSPDNGTTYIQLKPANIVMTPDNGTTEITIIPNLVTIAGSVLAIDVETITATARDNSGTATFNFNGGINMNATEGVTMNNAEIDSSGDITTPGTGTFTGNVTGGGVSLESHVHSGVETGGDDTGPPT